MLQLKMLWKDYISCRRLIGVSNGQIQAKKYPKRKQKNVLKNG